MRCAQQGLAREGQRADGRAADGGGGGVDGGRQQLVCSGGAVGRHCRRPGGIACKTVLLARLGCVLARVERSFSLHLPLAGAISCRIRCGPSGRRVGWGRKRQVGLFRLSPSLSVGTWFCFVGRGGRGGRAAGVVDFLLEQLVTCLAQDQDQSQSDHRVGRRRPRRGNSN